MSHKTFLPLRDSRFQLAALCAIVSGILIASHFAPRLALPGHPQAGSPSASSSHTTAEPPRAASRPPLPSPVPKRAATPATPTHTAAADAARAQNDFFNGRYTLAMKWDREAAARGFAGAANQIGAMYAHGLGVPLSYSQAMRWFREAAAHGNHAAESNIGTMYQKGMGVPQDYHEALYWFEKAAAHGDPNAEFSIGRLYARGHGVGEDARKAMRWFLKAAAHGLGMTKADDAIGNLFESGKGVRKNGNTALRWYLKAATQGDLLAENAAGRLYQDGDDPSGNAAGPQRQSKLAMHWFRAAAAQGSAYADRHIGMMYESGEGVPVSCAKALIWYGKAAAKGDNDAIGAIANLRSRGCEPSG